MKTNEALISRRSMLAGTAAMLTSAATVASSAMAQEKMVSAQHTGPVKRLQLAHPREGITPQEFHDHWRHPHATLVRDMRGNRKYVQHHRISSKAFHDSDSTYLAVAEVWQGSVAAADQSYDPQFIKYVQPDEPNFVDPSKHIITLTAEDIVQASRRMVDPEASVADLYWSDKDANIYTTLFQFVRNRDLIWTVDQSLEISKQLGAFRQIINRSVEADSQMALIRQFTWPSLWSFEQAVKANRKAFDSLRQTPSSFLYLAQSERVF